MEQIDQAADSVRSAVEGAKLRFLNMPLTIQGEKIINDRLTVLAAISISVAMFLLIVMTDRPAFFFTAIIVGVVAAIIDFLVEYKGIHFMDWEYARKTPKLRLRLSKFCTIFLVFFPESKITTTTGPNKVSPPGRIQMLMPINAPKRK